MIGLVLVTHGRLADELRSAMEHVVGAQRNVGTVCIGPDDDMESRRTEISTLIDQVDMGDGVVLLTDMFGGTPSNLAISLMLRSIPFIVGAVGELRDAVRARGLRPNPVRLVTPAVISAVAYAQRTGEALAARGFD